MSFIQQQRELTEQQDANWERNDFPIVCEPCLGENPYVRMMKAKFDKECKICQRPFTVFRWRNGVTPGLKQTEVCQTCAKLKNCCQSCILDLEFGLPTQIRDAGLSIKGLAEAIPTNTANRDWMQTQAEKEMAAGQGRWGRHGVETVVTSLMRMQPYYDRNRAHTCSMWLRGECARGDACPYKHEMPTAGALASVSANFGTDPNDASATIGAPPPPADEGVTTLYLGNIDVKRVTDSDLRSKLEAYGPLRAVRLVPKRKCAFAEFEEREHAEKAISMLFGRFTVNGCDIALSWSFQQSTKTEAERLGLKAASNVPKGRLTVASSATSSKSTSTPTVGGAAPPPPGQGKVVYASQSATQLGVVRKSATITEK